ncbi:MAG: PD40 domain-containing protein [Planctomycetes bacterium]|nr:PD40 domain-containing protein [Planctomycetota bacterium]
MCALVAGAQEPAATDVREQIKWHVLEAGDFEVHYPGEDLVPAAREVAAWLEAARVRMEKELDFKMGGPVRVVLYRSRLQARKSSLLQEAPGELGLLLAEVQKRRIVVPAVASPKAMQRTLEHQLAHILMEQAHYGRSALSRSILEYKKVLYPDWLLEGLAESLAPAREPAEEMLVRDAALDDALPDLSTLHGSDALSEHERGQFQVHAALAVQWLARATPRGSVKRLFHVFDSDLPWPTARLVKRATGMSYGEAEKGLRAELVQGYRAWAEGREEPAVFSREARPRRTYYRVYEIGPVWSPDGGKLAFFDDRDGYQRITVLDLETGEESSLLSAFLRVSIDSVKAQDRGLDWSPDGRTICFVGDRLGRAYLYFKSVDGSGLRRIALPFDDISQPQYSPDGKQVAFVGMRAGKSDIYVLGVDTVEVYRLTRHDWPETDPAWSPDGKRLAYCGETDGQFDLYMMDLATRQVERLTSGATNEVSPAWRPDGGALTFASDAEGAFNLYSADLTSRALTRHTFVPGGAFAPRWKPGGAEILFTSYRHGRFTARIMSPRTSGPAPALDDPRRAEQNRRWFVRRAEHFRIREYKTRIEFESILPTSAQLADLFQHHEFDTKVDYKLQSGGYELGGRVTYKNRALRPDIKVSVFGTTDRDSDGVETRYGAEAGITYPIDRFTGVGAEYFIAHRSADGDPGEKRVSEVEAGFRVSASRRDVLKRRRDPIAGYAVGLAVETLLPEVGSDRARVNYSGDLRGYVELWEDWVVAARLRGFKTNGHDAEDVGLKDYVRGYGSGEPQGTDLLAATVELRFPLWRDIDWALPGQVLLVKDLRAFVFFDIAVLSSEENILNMLLYPVREEWHHSAGIGLRLDTFLLEQDFVPVILTVSKATDGTEEAPSGFKYEINFDLGF